MSFDEKLDCARLGNMERVTDVGWWAGING